MNFLLDTNILVHYLRKDAVAAKVDRFFQPFAPGNRAIVSVVSFGEIKSFAIQNAWGATKFALLDRLLLTVVRADLSLDIVERYAEIDAFSQGKLSGKPLPISARNMGKNDLWIAATASVLGTKLLTTDADFDHLASVFVDLGKVEMS